MSSRPANSYPRNGSNNATNNSSSRLGTPNTNPQTISPGVGSPMSRAEKFEDEKRRIIESCFSKLDQSGQLAESYITHIRIIEDAQHPSAPPPPDSADANKKPRLIIIAVRSTGRVRMHKARENNNGSFSIGKTWNMEELSAIESYAATSIPPLGERDSQYRAWAGDVGFTVTILKPYYWQAGTAKEKDFFIASAVKIYRKYTKGQVPDLRGFDERAKMQILGGVPAPTAPPPGQLPREPSQQSAPVPPQPPFAQRDQSQDGSRYRQSPGPPPSISEVRPGSGPTSRRPSGSPARFAQNGPNGPRPSASTEQIRLPGKDNRPPELRPGTSPGPGYRSPSSGTGQRSVGQPPPSPLPLESPRFPHGSLASDSLRSESPGRYDTSQQSVDGASERRKPSTSSAASGADLFQQARDRYMNYIPSGTPPTPKLPLHNTLPPIETSQRSGQAANGEILDPVEQAGPTAEAESSAGVDLNNAAAVGALTSYFGPEPTPASAPTGAADPASPPTPERSKHRPKASGDVSQSGIDLQPPPLSPSRKLSNNVTRGPPLPGSFPTEETDPVIQPLQVQNKPDVSLSTQRSLTQTEMGSSAGQNQADTYDEHADEEEQYRPGLGPMFKKRAIADRFKKAANAANAFKPRPGGAAERILQAKADRDSEPDGITGVVPRPAPRSKQDEQAPAAPVQDQAFRDTPGEQPPPVNEQPPAVEISSPHTPMQQEPLVSGEPRRSVELFDGTDHLRPNSSGPPLDDGEQKLEQRPMRQPQGRIKRRSAQQEKYLASLDIDRSLLEGKGLDFELMLADFGWNSDILQPKQLAILEADIRREQGRVEAGIWLSHSDAAREERITSVEGLLDKAIAECDELEGLLTLYHVELSSLNEDIAFIEAQSQGLQVQSANQKLLQTELQGLVDTMSLDRRVMEPIRSGDLSDPHGLADVEKSLVRLYQAILTMDPSIGKGAPNRPRSRIGVGDVETSNMSALREKKITYDRETAEFCKRLMQFLDARFTASMTAAKSRVLRVPGGGALAKLNAEAFAEVRNGLWMYSPLILFAKEVKSPAWQTMMRMYHTRAAFLYGDAFKENISNWRKAARASTGDEMDILFTAQEKEDPASGGLTSTARRITVKRSHTLAKTLRNASGVGGGEKHSVIEQKQPGAMMRCQAFAGALDEMAPLMSREQNFFVDFFHANSLETEDFMDAVEAAWPAARRGTNLLERKPLDPDRSLAQLVTQTMGDIFSSFGRELDNMLHWSMSDDPLQGVGIMANLARHTFYLQESNQEFILQLVRDVFEKLQSRFGKFVEEQIRAIEDTKVKIKKRKGVIAFMKIFPHFSAAVENIFASVARDDYDGPAECVQEVRGLVDEAYERINRAMFDSLKVIAKESPVAGVSNAKPAPSGDDPEDKEMLNYHILLIENMNHYVEEVDDGGRQGVLAEWKGRAMMERAEALDAYVGRVIRRPLGKLLDFLESAESILSTNHNPSAVSARPSYSRKAMRTVLAQHDGKEIRRGIDVLRKRIEKHFGEADEEALSRNLVGFVCKECERAYERVLDRADRLVADVYPPAEGEKDVVVDFSRADLHAAFKR